MAVGVNIWQREPTTCERIGKQLEREASKSFDQSFPHAVTMNELS